MHDVTTVTFTVESMMIICDFSDVFPANFPWLSLEREIDFVIEVEISTKTISIPLY